MLWACNSAEGLALFINFVSSILSEMMMTTTEIITSKGERMKSRISENSSY